jgi:hypothetical protein
VKYSNTVRGIAVIRNMILQLINTMQMKAIMICPKAQPIENIIGVAARATYPVTSEIDKREAL